MLRQTLRAGRYYLAKASFGLAPLVGRKSHYGIHPGYRHRLQVRYFDDTANEDSWQREVYLSARDIMASENLRTVYDVGCGSGYKLVHLLGDYDTTGIDLEPTIARVRALYPDRNWVSQSFEQFNLEPADLVICSDVIEHVDDPDLLMRVLVRATRKWAVISTPDRELGYGPGDRHIFGPPANWTHMREWNMPEFRAFVARYFDVVRHEITNSEQATQMIVARRRD